MNAERSSAGKGLWQETSDEVCPRDGELVMVRRGRDRDLVPMIFRASPIMRWESPDGVRVFDFRYFDQWRRA